MACYSKECLNGNLDRIAPSLSVVFNLGRVVRKPVNDNPSLKVNRGNNFSSTEMFFTAYVLCRLRLLKLKTEEQTI